jgi:hypothetical protein
MVLNTLLHWLRSKSWKPECVGSFNMDWRILVFYPEPEAMIKFNNIRQSMLKLKTHYGFHDLVRFWYVWEYKYGSILWLEDGNLYLRLRKMSQNILNTICWQWKSQSHSPAHVLMSLYQMDNSLVCYQSERRSLC